MYIDENGESYSSQDNEETTDTNSHGDVPCYDDLGNGELKLSNVEIYDERDNLLYEICPCHQNLTQN